MEAIELTGDPVIDYMEGVMLYAQQHHIDWIFLFPDAFNKNYSEEEQRSMLRAMRDKFDKLVGCPAAPDAVKSFIDGGPRPEITG